MTYREAVKVLADRARTGFTDLQVWPDPNANVTLAAAGGVRLDFSAGPEVQMGTSGVSDAYFSGLLSMVASILVPLGTGQGPIWGYVDQFCALFRGWASSDLVVRSVRPEEVGPTGSLYQVNVIVTVEKWTQTARAV